MEFPLELWFHRPDVSAHSLSPLRGEGTSPHTSVCWGQPWEAHLPHHSRCGRLLCGGEGPPSGLGTPPCSRTEPRRGGAGRGALPHPSQGRVGFSSALLPFSCGQLDKPLRLVRCQLPNWHFGAVVPSERWLWDSAQGAPRASRGAGPGRPPKCRFPSGLRSSRHRGCWGDRPVCISWGT